MVFNVPGNNADYALWVTGGSTPCSPVSTYCTAKQTSTGSTPAIGSTGTPSLATQNFVVTLSGATTSSTSNVFWGLSGGANIPFGGGTLCVMPPAFRGPPSTTSPTGTDSYSVPIDITMVGQNFRYQWWFRDTGFAPPNNIGLSEGLNVTFCNQ